MAAQEPLRSEITCIQISIKEQLSILKSSLTSHNKIISDVRILLKSLAKVSIIFSFLHFSNIVCIFIRFKF